ncbi:hypothetical protein [Streptomyces marokkonensis]|uniref:hypothetical protein n=1 Tax=Streptomyces marokkonensis TaxID=324855 RepID=UPI001FCC13FA|nr:hypothetical protein [Streptomyces marokkonensis]
MRHITYLNGTACYDDVQQHFAGHPTRPIPLTQIGGTLTSLAAAQRRIGPIDTDPLLQRNEHTRRYRTDPVLVEGLRRAFTLADTRPYLLRH